MIAVLEHHQLHSYGDRKVEPEFANISYRDGMDLIPYRHISDVKQKSGMAPYISAFGKINCITCINISRPCFERG